MPASCVDWNASCVHWGASWVWTGLPAICVNTGAHYVDWDSGQLCGPGASCVDQGPAAWPGVSCENGVPAQARLRLDGVSAACLLHVLLFITLMFSSSNFNKSRLLNQTVFTQHLCCRIEDVFLWCEEKKMSLRIIKPSLGTGQNFWNHILKGKNIYTRRFICSYLLNAYYVPDIV